MDEPLLERRREPLQRLARAAHGALPRGERERCRGGADLGAELRGIFRAQIAHMLFGHGEHLRLERGAGGSRRRIFGRVQQPDDALDDALDGRAAAQGQRRQLNVEPRFDRRGQFHGHQRVHAHVQQGDSRFDPLRDDAQYFSHFGAYDLGQGIDQCLAGESLEPAAQILRRLAVARARRPPCAPTPENFGACAAGRKRLSVDQSRSISPRFAADESRSVSSARNASSDLSAAPPMRPTSASSTRSLRAR